MSTRIALFAIAFAAVAAGCTAEDRASLEWGPICFPEDAEACGTSGECEKVLASTRPFVYTNATDAFSAVVFNNQLDLFVQFNNQLPNNADETAGRVNTNDAVIEEYRLDFSVPGLSIPSASYPAYAVIPAASSQTPIVPVIPAATLQIIEGLIATTAVVTVDIVARGRLMDGTEFEAGPQQFAVDVIDGTAARPGCSTAGEVVVAVCPHEGQSASVACAAP